MLGNEYVESILWLRQQIQNIRHTRSHLIPNSSDEDESIDLMNAAQLRGWLYSFYAHNDMWDDYELVHSRAQLKNKRRRLDITTHTLELREKLFSEVNQPDLL